MSARLRLEGWEEIARYTGLSLKILPNLARNHGLPVKGLLHAAGDVEADSLEVEAWLESKTAKPDGWSTPIRHRVYFIQDALQGHIKIGTSIDVRKRLGELQMATSVQLRVLATMHGSYPEERELHRRFDEYRVSGEWFQACPLLLRFIAEVATPWRD